MSTALARVEAALQADVTVAAQQMAMGLDTFDPEKMSDADCAALVDRGTVISIGLRKLTEDRAEVNRGFDELKRKTTAKLSAIIEELTAAKKQAGDLYTAYRRIVTERVAAAEREQRRLADEAAKATTKDGPAGAPAPPAAVVESVPVQNTVKSGLGQASGRKQLMVKMVDAKLVAERYPHLLELVNSAALIEARAMLTRCKNDEKKMAEEMLKGGIEAWYAEGSPAFGVRR